MTTGDPMVVVDGLVKRYDARTVLDGVSLTISGGELVALLGPNGAGKTTTVEIIEGYRRGDGGSVRVLGIDPAAGGPALRARVGLMLQNGGIDPRAQPRETLRQYGRFHERPTRRRRAARPRRAAHGRANAVPAPVGGRAAAARAGARARRAARGRDPRRADRGDGPGSPCHDPGDRRGPARRRRRGPADEPRPDRRRAAGRSDLHPRRRTDRRVGDARRAAGRRRRHVSGSGSTGRSRLPSRRRWAPRWPRSGPARGSCPTATARAIDSTARSPMPRSWPRSPAGRQRPIGSSSSCGPRAAASRTSISSWSARAGRTMTRGATTPPGRTTHEPARIAGRGHDGPDRDGAAADRPARRERARDDHHPGRRPPLLRLGRACCRPGAALPWTSSCRGRSRWRSSRPASSTSGSRPPTSATTAS